MSEPTCEPRLDAVVLLRMHFRELALRFLDSYNPQPVRAIVIADCICSYDGELDDKVPMRHQAHDFVTQAMRAIDRGEPCQYAGRFVDWINNWNSRFGP